jgi:GNAT superfamily N-acetyltransferase
MNRGAPLPAQCATRLAVERDLNPLCNLLQDCIENMRAHGIDQWDDVYPSRGTLATDIQSGTAYVAALFNADLAGFLVLNDYQDPEYADVAWSINGVPIAVVHRLMVHPAHQQQGLARFLMRFAEERAMILGYGAIRLDAFSANPRALRLYQGLGYRDAGGVTFRKGAFRCFEKTLLPQIKDADGRQRRR